MRIIKKGIARLKNKIWKYNHKKLCRKNQNKLKNHDVSIISMNCTGGILSHDLGLQFKSPTVNLFFRAEDFIKFCENIEHYFEKLPYRKVMFTHLQDKNIQVVII